jgi:hypothetical protein
MNEKEQAIGLKLKKARALMSEVEIQLQNHFMRRPSTAFIIVVFMLLKRYYLQKT